MNINIFYINSEFCYRDTIKPFSAFTCDVLFHHDIGFTEEY